VRYSVVSTACVRVKIVGTARVRVLDGAGARRGYKKQISLMLDKCHDPPLSYVFAPARCIYFRTGFLARSFPYEVAL
jgi:hypothetical protein